MCIEEELEQIRINIAALAQENYPEYEEFAEKEPVGEYALSLIDDLLIKIKS